jgi:hypothetical protein
MNYYPNRSPMGNAIYKCYDYYDDTLPAGDSIIDAITLNEHVIIHSAHANNWRVTFTTVEDSSYFLIKWGNSGIE